MHFHFKLHQDASVSALACPEINFTSFVETSIKMQALCNIHKSHHPQPCLCRTWSLDHKYQNVPGFHKSPKKVREEARCGILKIPKHKCTISQIHSTISSQPNNTLNSWGCSCQQFWQEQFVKDFQFCQELLLLQEECVVQCPL